MLKKNEIEILEVLFDNLTSKETILSISKKLNQKYAQTYRTIKELQNKKLVFIEKIGNYNIVNLDFDSFHLEYVIVEILRTQKCSKIIHKIINKLVELEDDFCVVLFGSYANNTQNKESDIDLLIITDNEERKKKLKNKLSLYNCDLNFVKKDELFSMWNSKKLNIGNETLKKHKVLIGYDYFVTLLFQKNHL